MLPATPLVSVRITTYNQAKYIEQCLDSVLMQKTDFPFEVCIGEDESSDGTREICIRYAEQHPDKIRLFLRSRKNVIYINGLATGKFNARETNKTCRGKYIALLEGDDFWIDECKLQKQVDIFRADPDVVMVHSERRFQNDITGEVLERWHQSKGMTGYNSDRETLIKLLQNRLGFALCSMCLNRKWYFDLPNKFPWILTEQIPNGDKVLSALALHTAKVAYIDEPLVCYRRNPGTLTSHQDEGTSRKALAFSKGDLRSLEVLAEVCKLTAEECIAVYDVRLPAIAGTAARWSDKELAKRCLGIAKKYHLANLPNYRLLNLFTLLPGGSVTLRAWWKLRQKLDSTMKS